MLVWFRQPDASATPGLWPVVTLPMDITFNRHGDMVRGEWLCKGVNVPGVYVVETFTHSPYGDLCTMYRDSYSAARSIDLGGGNVHQLVGPSPTRIAFLVIAFVND